MWVHLSVLRCIFEYGMVDVSEGVRVRGAAPGGCCVAMATAAPLSLAVAATAAAISL